MAKNDKKLAKKTEAAVADSSEKASKAARKAAEEGVKKSKKSDKPKLGQRIKNWFRTYKSELKKIVWASWPDVLRNTGLVLVCMIAIAAVIALLDFGFQHALSGLTSLIGR